MNASKKKVRILHIGDFRFDFYDQSLFDQFRLTPGVEVEKFEIAPYFQHYRYKGTLQKIVLGLQNRYKFGPLIDKINNDIMQLSNSRQYDLVFIWRGIHIKPATLLHIKATGAKLFGYNNDSTYSSRHPKWLFSLLKKQIRHYDHFYSYRESEIPQYQKNGCPSSLFLPTFDASRTFPVPNVRNVYDLVYIGHYEKDDRDQLFVELAKTGYRIGLFGQGWQESPLYPELRKIYGDIKPVYADYNQVINSATIALTLLSKANGDSYTRRTLEIPSTKTAMLAQYTEKQAKWFAPDIEAFYFKDYTEIPALLGHLFQAPEKVNSVAKAGYAKVIRGDFQLKHRVEMIINDYCRLSHA